MSSWSPVNPPEHKGKMHQPKSLQRRNTCTDKPYLKMRYKQDDSETVNMSDSKLGGGIRDFTKV